MYLCQVDTTDATVVHTGRVAKLMIHVCMYYSVCM